VVEDQGMSMQEAAAIVQDARARARKQLVISAPVVYAAWGLVWLIGYGVMWLSVRGQHPYRAPSGVSVAAVLVLAASRRRLSWLLPTGQLRASAASPRETAASFW
jgi:hypothetical protein